MAPWVFARSLIKELCIIIPCTVTSVQLCDDLLLWDYALVLLELDDFFDIDREKYNDTGEYISKKNSREGYQMIFNYV